MLRQNIGKSKFFNMFFSLFLILILFFCFISAHQMRNHKKIVQHSRKDHVILDSMRQPNSSLIPLHHKWFLLVKIQQIVQCLTLTSDHQPNNCILLSPTHQRLLHSITVLVFTQQNILTCHRL